MITSLARVVITLCGILALLASTASAACPECHSFAECVDNTECKCLPGFLGDGVTSCELDVCVQAETCADCIALEGCSFCAAGENAMCVNSNSDLLQECASSNGTVTAPGGTCTAEPLFRCSELNPLTCGECESHAGCTTCLDPASGRRTCVPKADAIFHCPTESTIESGCPATTACSLSSDCAAGEACLLGSCHCIIAPEGEPCAPFTSSCGSQTCSSHEDCDGSNCQCTPPYTRVDGSCTQLNTLVSNSGRVVPRTLDVFEQANHAVNTHETTVIRVPSFQQVQVRVASFNLEEGIASVTLYDGDSPSATVLAVIQGASVVVDQVFTSSASSVTVVYQTKLKGYTRRVGEDAGVDVTDFRLVFNGLNPLPDAIPCVEARLTPDWPSLETGVKEAVFLALPEGADLSSESACVRWIWDPIINTTLVTLENYQVSVAQFTPKSSATSLTILSGDDTLASFANSVTGHTDVSPDPMAVEMRGNLNSTFFITLSVTEPNMTPKLPDGKICSTESKAIAVNDGEFDFEAPAAGAANNCFEWPVETTARLNFKISFAGLAFPAGAELRVYPDDDVSASPFVLNDLSGPTAETTFTSATTKARLVVVYNGLNPTDFETAPFNATFIPGDLPPFPRQVCESSNNVTIDETTGVLRVTRQMYYGPNICDQDVIRLDPEIYSHIKVEVITYGIADVADSLAFYDGDDVENDDLLTVLNGMLKNEVNTSDIDPLLDVARPKPAVVLETTGPVLTTVFYTNEALSGTGYDYYLVAVKKGIDTECRRAGSIDLGVPEDGIGSIELTSYRAGLCREWLVEATDPSVPIVEFELLSANIERNQDRILLFDGAEQSDRNLITIVNPGSNITGIPRYYSRSSQLLVVFTADNSIEFDGFTAAVRSVAANPNGNGHACERDQTVLTTPVGKIATIVPYEAGACAEWVIKAAAPATRIRIIPSLVDLEDADAIRVFDGINPIVPFSASAEFNDTDVPVVSKLNGTMNVVADPIVITTTKPESLILLRSKAERVARNGFEATYFAIDDDGCVTENVNAPGGTFTSAYGVTPYPSNFCQRWVISADGFDFARFNGFSEWGVPDKQDTVVIYNGETASSPVLAEYDGSSDVYLNFTLQASSPKLLVEFRTNAVSEGAGFTFSFNGTNTPVIKRELRNGVFCARGIDAKFSPINVFAEVTRTEETATIASTPIPYLEQSCHEWILNPTDFERVRLQFTKFDLEEGYDYVTIYAGDNRDAPVVKRLTGSELPRSVLVKKPMMVVFESDADIAKSGFEAIHEGINGPVFDRSIIAATVDATEDIPSPVREFFIIGGEDEDVRVRFTVRHGQLSAYRGEQLIEGEVFDISGTVFDVNRVLANLTYTGHTHYCTEEQGAELMNVELGYNISGILEATDELEGPLITVACVNDAPAINVLSEAITIREDEASSVPAFTVRDVDALSFNGPQAGDNLCQQPECSQDPWIFDFAAQMTARVSASSGRVFMLNTARLTVDSQEDTAIEVTGTLTALNDALHTLFLVSDANACGTPITLTLSVSDQGARGAEDPAAPLTAEATKSIAVSCRDDTPTLSTPQVITVSEDGDAVAVGLSISDIDGTPTGVEYSATLKVSHGTLVAGSGSPSTELTVTGADVTAFNEALAAVQYKPDANYCTTYGPPSDLETVEVQISSGEHAISARVPVAIACSNDAPVVTQPREGNYTQGGAGFLSAAVSDSDSPFVRATITSAKFALDLDIGISTYAGVAHLDSRSNTVVLYGTVSQVNALFSRVKLVAYWATVGDVDEAVISVQDGDRQHVTTFTTKAFVLAQVSPPVVKLLDDDVEAQAQAGLLKAVQETEFGFEVYVGVEDPTEQVTIAIVGDKLASVTGAGVTKTGANEWTVNGRKGSVTALPKFGYCGTSSVTVTATTTEPSTGEQKHASTTSDLKVDCVAKKPNLAAPATVSGNEDTSIAIPISASVQHPQHETLTVRVAGIPAGAALDPAVTIVDGKATLDVASLGNYRVVPASHDGSGFTLEVTAITTVTAPIGSAEVQQSIAVTVNPIPDAVTLNAPADVTGPEEEIIAIPISATTADKDGSESLSYQVTGVPAHATLQHATDADEDGTWDIDVDQIANFGITVSRGAVFDIQITAKSREDAGASSPSSATKTVTVRALGVATSPLVFMSKTIHVPLHSINHNKDDDFYKFPSMPGNLPASLPTDGKKDDHDDHDDDDDDDDVSSTWEKVIGDDNAFTFYRTHFSNWIYGYDDDYGDSSHSTSLFKLRDGLHKDSACHRAKFSTFQAPCDCSFKPDTGKSNSKSKSKSGSKRSKKDFPCEKKALLYSQCMFVSVPFPVELSIAEVGEALSTTVQVTLNGASPCVRLNMGTLQDAADDISRTWTIALADLPSLRIYIPDDYARTSFEVTVSATATEGSSSATITKTSTIIFNNDDIGTFNAIATGPSSVSSLSEEVALKVDATRVGYLQGTETITATVNGLPSGFSLRTYDRVISGSSAPVLNYRELTQDVHVIAPAGYTSEFDGPVLLTFVLEARRASDGKTQTYTMDVFVEIFADTDRRPSHTIALSADLATGSRTKTDCFCDRVNDDHDDHHDDHDDHDDHHDWSDDHDDHHHHRYFGKYKWKYSINHYHYHNITGKCHYSPESVLPIQSFDASVPISMHGIRPCDYVSDSVRVGSVWTTNNGVSNPRLTALPEAGPFVLTTTSKDGSRIHDVTRRATIVIPRNDLHGISYHQKTFASLSVDEDSSTSLQVSHVPALNTDIVRGGTLQSVNVFGIPAGARILFRGAEISADESGHVALYGPFDSVSATLDDLVFHPPAESSKSISLVIQHLFNATVPDLYKDDHDDNDDSDDKDDNDDHTAPPPPKADEVTVGVFVTALIKVRPVLDITLPPRVVTAEDTEVSLQLGIAEFDIEQKQHLQESSLAVKGMPTGASLSAGASSGADWIVDMADLSCTSSGCELAFTPAKDWSGALTLEITPSTRGVSDNTYSVQVVVNAVCDDPVLTVEDVQGVEDTDIPLSIALALSDTDSSETLSVQIAGVPTAASLSAGTVVADDGRAKTYSVPVSALSSLKYLPVQHSDLAVTLTVTGTSTEGSTDSVKRACSVEATATVATTAVADQPTLTVNAPDNTREDESFTVELTSALVDRDGSESLTLELITSESEVRVQGLDRDASGHFVIPAGTASIVVQPPKNFAETLSLTFRLTSTEVRGKDTAVREVSVEVGVIPLSEKPAITSFDSIGAEDECIPLLVTARTSDKDGSESVSVVLRNIPAGFSIPDHTITDGAASLSLGAIGTNCIIPATDVSGTFTFEVLATTSDGGSTSEETATIVLTVQPRADPPTLSIASDKLTTNEDEGVVLGLTAALADTDGSESLRLVVHGLPAGATISTGQLLGDEAGAWLVPTADLSSAALLLPRHASGAYHLEAYLISEESETPVLGGRAATRVAFSVTATPVVDSASLASVADLVGVSSSAEGVQSFAFTLAPQLADIGENAQVVIGGIPARASVSGGAVPIGPRDVVSRSYLFTADALAVANGVVGVTLDSADNDKTTFDLTVAVIHAEADIDSVSVATYTITVNTAVAATPVVSVLSAVTSNEDGWVSLSSVIDLSGASGVQVTASAGPAFAVEWKAANGVVTTDSSITGSPAFISGVTVKAPAHFSGAGGSLTFEARSTSTTAKSAAYVPWTVAPVADTPVLNTPTGVSQVEDTPVRVPITGDLADIDGSEFLAFKVSGLPDGARITPSGTIVSDGRVFTPSEAALLVITPPLNLNRPYTVSVTATATERATGESASATKTIHFEVQGIADPPRATAEGSSGPEDTAIPIIINAASQDGDGSEVLTVIIDGVPATASLSAGERRSDGSYLLQIADLASLTFTPPPHAAGLFELDVTVIASEQGTTASSSLRLPVVVNPVADVPAIGVPATVSTHEDEQPVVPVSITTADTDGSEELSLTITASAGAKLVGLVESEESGKYYVSNPEALSSVKVSFPAHFHGVVTLAFEAQSRDASSTSISSAETQITVIAQADAPTITVDTAAAKDQYLEDTAFPLADTGLAIGLVDTDSSESLAICLGVTPAGAASFSGAAADVARCGEGRVLVAASGVSGVTVTPAAHLSGEITISVQAIAIEASLTADPREASAHVSIPVVIAPVADTPTIATCNDLSGTEDEPIFVPVEVTTADTDGSESIEAKVTLSPADVAQCESCSDDGVISAAALKARGGFNLVPSKDYAGSVTVTIQITVRDTFGALVDVATSANDLCQSVISFAQANDGPEAKRTIIGLPRDHQAVFDISGTDPDEGDVLSFSIATLPKFGSLHPVLSIDESGRVSTGPALFPGQQLTSTKLAYRMKIHSRDALKGRWEKVKRFSDYPHETVIAVDSFRFSVSDGEEASQAPVDIAIFKYHLTNMEAHCDTNVPGFGGCDCFDNYEPDTGTTTTVRCCKSSVMHSSNGFGIPDYKPCLQRQSYDIHYDHSSSPWYTVAPGSATVQGDILELMLDVEVTPTDSDVTLTGSIVVNAPVDAVPEGAIIMGEEADAETVREASLTSLTQPMSPVVDVTVSDGTTELSAPATLCFPYKLLKFLTKTQRSEQRMCLGYINKARAWVCESELEFDVDCGNKAGFGVRGRTRHFTPFAILPTERTPETVTASGLDSGKPILSNQQSEAGESETGAPANSAAYWAPVLALVVVAAVVAAAIQVRRRRATVAQMTKVAPAPLTPAASDASLDIDALTPKSSSSLSKLDTAMDNSLGMHQPSFMSASVSSLPPAPTLSPEKAKELLGRVLDAPLTPSKSLPSLPVLKEKKPLPAKPLPRAPTAPGMTPTVSLPSLLRKPNREKPLPPAPTPPARPKAPEPPLLE